MNAPNLRPAVAGAEVAAKQNKMLERLLLSSENPEQLWKVAAAQAKSAIAQWQNSANQQQKLSLEKMRRTHASVVEEKEKTIFALVNDLTQWIQDLPGKCAFD